jgi:hypothetical protein
MTHPLFKIFFSEAISRIYYITKALDECLFKYRIRNPIRLFMDLRAWPRAIT